MDKIIRQAESDNPSNSVRPSDHDAFVLQKALTENTVSLLDAKSLVEAYKDIWNCYPDYAKHGKDELNRLQYSNLRFRRDDGGILRLCVANSEDIESEATDTDIVNRKDASLGVPSIMTTPSSPRARSEATVNGVEDLEGVFGFDSVPDAADIIVFQAGHAGLQAGESLAYLPGLLNQFYFVKQYPSMAEIPTGDIMSVKFAITCQGKLPDQPHTEDAEHWAELKAVAEKGRRAVMSPGRYFLVFLFYRPSEAAELNTARRRYSKLLDLVFFRRMLHDRDPIFKPMLAPAIAMMEWTLPSQ